MDTEELPSNLIADGAFENTSETPTYPRYAAPAHFSAVNAVADAAKRGVSLQGTICYVTHFPCVNCAKILAAAGITEVRYRHDYKNDPLVAEMFGQAGVLVTHLER